MGKGDTDTHTRTHNQHAHTNKQSHSHGDTDPVGSCHLHNNFSSRLVEEASVSPHHHCGSLAVTQVDGRENTLDKVVQVVPSGLEDTDLPPQAAGAGPLVGVRGRGYAHHLQGTGVHCSMNHLEQKAREEFERNPPEREVKIPTPAIISTQYYGGTSEAQNNLSTVCVCVSGVRREGGLVREDPPSHMCREITVTGLRGPVTSVGVWVWEAYRTPPVNICSCALSSDVQKAGWRPSSQMYLALFLERIFALSGNSECKLSISGAISHRLEVQTEYVFVGSTYKTTLIC